MFVLYKYGFFCAWIWMQLALKQACTGIFPCGEVQACIISERVPAPEQNVQAG